MIYLFWFSLAAILYICVGYPLLITLVARWRPLPWRRAPWTGLVPPVSVVVAFNKDASQLSEQVAHLLSLDPGLIKEIIVVADGSPGATPAILPYVTDRRVRIVLLRERVGGPALDHGIAAASSEIILFVGVRPRLQPGAIAALLSNFADVAIGCVAGEMIPDTHGNPAAEAIFGLYGRYERRIRSREALVDSTTVPHGGFYAIRRVLARPVPPGLILNDVLQSLAIRRQGYRSVIDRSAVAIDAWSTSCASEFRSQARTFAGNFQLIAKAPWVLRYENRVRFQVVSHHLLRLLVPYFLLLLLISSLLLGEHSLVYLSIAFLQTAFWLIAAVSLRAPIFLRRVAGTAGALLVLNAAAMAALFMFLFPRSRLRKIWTPKFAVAKKSWRDSLSDQRGV
jgi:cellulose synthase/poly-beta-1,6-N-acetylglucosamine synthase-like glycosyltransferase